MQADFLVEQGLAPAKFTNAYPAADKIGLEVAYNHGTPFRWGWILSLVAFFAALMAKGMKWKIAYVVAFASFGVALAAMIAGFWMRVAITGNAPVSNMYESVVYVGMGIAFLGLIFEAIYRKQFILIAATAVATVALIAADNAPAVLNESLNPLRPVLRNNFWLTTHVLTITLSYAAFALALGIADITLGYFLFGPRQKDIINMLSVFTYKTLQVGVVFLAIGIFTGAVWADYSWGRFWGWDAKETWSLIAMLIYMGVLHIRYTNWVGHFGLAAWSVGGFVAVVMTWYGVSFWYPSSLHSYGSGGDSATIAVACGLIAQVVYLALAMIRHFAGQLPSAESAASGS